jgi:hypothetical protein
MKELRKMILDGSDFATIAVNYSSEGAGINGGDLGYLSKDDVVHKPWMWTGSLSTYLYGTFQINSKNNRVHRLNYHQVFGSVPPDVLIRHIGDINKSDINLFSILTGNQKDNMCDSMENGNTLTGEDNGNYKLTNSQVYNIIRILYERETDITQKELAKICKVGCSLISKIGKNELRNESMKQFAKDRNITVKEVVNTIQINVGKIWKKVKSESHAGSNHHSAQLSQAPQGRTSGA